MRPRLPAWFAAALLAVLAIGSVLLLFRLHINNAPEVYFPSGAPAVVLDKQIRERFPQDQVLVLLFQGDDLYSTGFVRQLEWAARRMEANPLVERVFTVTTMDRIAGSEDGFVVEPLIDAGRLGPDSEALNRTRVLTDRFAPGLIASRDGTAVALVIRPIALGDSLKRMALLRETRAAVREAGIEPQLVAVGGQIALDVAELQSMFRDSLVFIPATTVIGLFLVWWLFRRPMAVVLAGATLGGIVTATVAIVAIWGRPYTLVASIIPPLMAALTTALLIHLYNGLMHASQRGYRGGERVVRALEEVRRPALFAALTTAAGLSSLGFSPIQPIQTFGVAAGIGVLLMYYVVMGLLPSMITAWDGHPWPTPRRGVNWIDAVVGAASRLAIRRAGWVVLVTATVLGAGLPYLARVQAETDLYKFFSDDHPLTRSTRLIERELSGVSTVEVVFDAPTRDGLKDPERLKALKAFQTWLETVPQVDRTMSLVDLVEEMNWAFHGEDTAYRTVPDSRRLISQYLFIYDGRDLFDLVDREFQRTRLTMNLSVTGANAIQEVIGRISRRLNEQPVADLQWHVAGLGRLFSDQEDLLIRGQVRSLWIALTVIFLLIWILWRSLPAAILCMIPNLSPILLIFVAMGLFGIWLDMATAMIASVAVGIAVDDTIHIYHSYARRVEAGRSPVLALMRTYRQAGRAVTATTFVLCAQLLLLTASAFVPTAEFGLLTSIGLLAALGFDLLLLPAVLVMLEWFRSRRRVQL